MRMGVSQNNLTVALERQERAPLLVFLLVVHALKNGIERAAAAVGRLMLRGSPRRVPTRGVVAMLLMLLLLLIHEDPQVAGGCAAVRVLRPRGRQARAPGPVAGGGGSGGAVLEPDGLETHGDARGAV